MARVFSITNLVNPAEKCDRVTGDYSDRINLEGVRSVTIGHTGAAGLGLNSTQKMVKSGHFLLNRIVLHSTIVHWCSCMSCLCNPALENFSDCREGIFESVTIQIEFARQSDRVNLEGGF